MSTRHLTDARKETLFGELHSLLASGLDFSNAFRLLIDGESDGNMRSTLDGLYHKVVAGSSLWQAIEGSGRFSTLDAGVMRIGEETGRLTDALEFLVDYYRKRIAQRRMVSSAVSYPLIIMVMALVVVIFMMAVIVPMFESVYSRMGGKLPAMTRWIISLSKSFGWYAALGVVIIGGVVTLLWAFRERPSVRGALSGVVMRMPLVGGIVRKSNEASFCKLLYLLTSSGVPLLTGVGMLRSIIRYYPYQSSFDAIAHGLERGESLNLGLERYPQLYDSRLVVLLRVGEETGRLPQMLRREGEELTRELEHRLRTLGSFLEPVFIIIVGALVAVILISMYLPMFRLGGMVG